MIGSSSNGSNSFGHQIFVQKSSNMAIWTVDHLHSNKYKQVLYTSREEANVQEVVRV
jgi:hypothetical protein